MRQKETKAVCFRPLDLSSSSSFKCFPGRDDQTRATKTYGARFDALARDDSSSFVKKRAQFRDRELVSHASGSGRPLPFRKTRRDGGGSGVRRVIKEQASSGRVY